MNWRNVTIDMHRPKCQTLELIRQAEEKTVPGRSARTRVVAPTLATAVVSSSVAVALNLATDWKTNVLAWTAVAILTLLSGVVALWLSKRQGEDPKIVETGGSNVARLGRNLRLKRGDLQAGRSNKFEAKSGADIEELTMRAGPGFGGPSGHEEQPNGPEDDVR